tara:strand:+ start:769 stop:1104 length:336 start_codon:yes stop_codon:yes gene_type:complete
MSRYYSRQTTKNDDELYEATLEDRGINYIKHYVTPAMSGLTVGERASLQRTKHIWKLGDKFFKLAAQYYGDPKMWWVIARYNTLPTEAHVSTGQIIYIPQPLTRVLTLFKG